MLRARMNSGSPVVFSSIEFNANERNHDECCNESAGSNFLG